MLRAIVVTAVLASTSAAAQVAPDNENGRYTFSELQGSMLRLDSRTGQVSVCSKRPAGWACEAVQDERTALENEIARLQGENATLKKEMFAHNIPLPGGVKGRRKPEVTIELPSDADLDRVMAFAEKIWRRLIDMVQRVQKDIDKKG